MSVNWRCPFCENYSTLTTNNMAGSALNFTLNNKFDDQLRVIVSVSVCPNQQCREVVIDAQFGRAEMVGSYYQIGDLFESWALRPSSLAISFPEYVPEPIRQDYEEACKIKILSPKASATLSRRCLQGIIRDYWGVRKGTLFEEISELKDRVDLDTWSAIDAVRKIGNIGAHMEKDINVVLDVEPEEAQLLIGLIEMLVKDWYVARHARQVHLAQIVQAAQNKKS
ncbi:hypothetical protein BK652_10020 [Pseudomonas brassicacearum]|uniref:DUF4145 domain-containing protein n=1 Tax=Pseudomonas brassicacearum TaxID=930166 RepID=A0A423GDI8_9PSED|nr:DUF4145 domain-containing protein [Pseudomonas brassicacearum]ROM84905.1 hypothetical protein BK652_10020 [Pseudomonas brassicacearum]